MLSKDEILTNISGVQPIIVDQELILDGTGNNHRPTELCYETTEHLITETRIYTHPADHSAWAGYRSEYEVKEVNNGQ